MISDSFEHGAPFSTARLTVSDDQGVGASIGTGFFYDAPLDDGTGRSITLLISNKHVFSGAGNRLALSLNKKKDDGSPDYGNVVDFQDSFENISYWEHPNQEIDLACINASPVSHTDCFFGVLNRSFINEGLDDELGPGISVLFVGYPENRYDVTNNLPLIRSGTIASLPSVDFNGQGQIVIDAQVFKGSSGSPVFANFKGHYYLLGVVSQTMIRHSQLQTLPTNIDAIGVEQILGLGIVIKARHVSELVSHAVRAFIAKNPGHRQI